MVRPVGCDRLHPVHGRRNVERIADPRPGRPASPDRRRRHLPDTTARESSPATLNWPVTTARRSRRAGCARRSAHRLDRGPPRRRDGARVRAGRRRVDPAAASVRRRHRARPQPRSRRRARPRDAGARVGPEQRHHQLPRRNRPRARHDGDRRLRRRRARRRERHRDRGRTPAGAPKSARRQSEGGRGVHRRVRRLDARPRPARRHRAESRGTSRPKRPATRSSTATATGRSTRATARPGIRVRYRPTGRRIAPAAGNGCSRGDGRGSTRRRGASRRSTTGAGRSIGGVWGWIPGRVRHARSTPRRWSAGRTDRLERVPVDRRRRRSAGSRSGRARCTCRRTGRSPTYTRNVNIAHVPTWPTSPTLMNVTQTHYAYRHVDRQSPSSRGRGVGRPAGRPIGAPRAARGLVANERRERAAGQYARPPRLFGRRGGTTTGDGRGDRSPSPRPRPTRRPHPSRANRVPAVSPTASRAAR